MTDDIGGVCIITQPERSQTGKEHVADLAAIIAELTRVSILTANLPPDSRLEREYEVVEYAIQGTGQRLSVEIFRFLRNQIRLCLAVRRRQEAVVLFFGTTSYVLPVILARLIGKRVIVLPRGDVPLTLRLRWQQTMPAPAARILAGVIRVLEGISYKTAHTLVTYTPEMATQLELTRYQDKLHTNGARYIDIESFDIQTPFNDRDRVVGFVGRLDVEKRVPILAAAVRKLPDDVTFLFVGDGEYRAELESTLESEGTDGRVQITGWVDREELSEQFNRMQLLVAPSQPTEGLPTVILEAMACGTPAYATPVSGVPDVVYHEETGFLMDDVDSEQIANDIRHILQREDLNSISENARSLITSEYSFAAAVDRYKEILK